MKFNRNRERKVLWLDVGNIGENILKLGLMGKNELFYHNK